MTAFASPTSTPAPALDAAGRLRARSRATGVLVFAGFGGLWAAGGAALSSAPAWAWLAIVAFVAGFAVTAARLLRTHPPVTESLPETLATRRARAGRIFVWTNVVEGLAILVAVNLLVNLGHAPWQTAAIMAIVGLHFLPLAVGFGYRPHALTGLAMTGWALAYPALFGAMSAAGPFGAAAILFASAAWALHSVRPSTPDQNRK